MISRFLRAALAASALAPVALVGGSAPAAAVTRPICFPVVEPVTYSDSFGAPRGDGTRAHEGNDLMGARGYRLLAAANGVVVDVRGPGEGTDNSVRIRGDDGWYYAYLHMNNDSPGTDDGLATWDQIFAPGIVEGARVRAGQLLGYMGDSGNAETTSPHLHFELRQPAPTVWQSVAVSPYDSLRSATRCPQGGAVTPMGWYLRDELSRGPAEVVLDFGLTSYLAVPGDYDGDGQDSIGIWEPATSTFFLRDDLEGGRADVAVTYGTSAYVPLTGDWDGDGDDTIGIYDPTTRTFHLRNSNDAGPSNLNVTFGSSGWRPVVGDWDGNGTDTVGAFDPATATFHLRNSTISGPAQVTVGVPGASAAEPVVGDWDGDGDDTPGVFTDGAWRLLTSAATGSPEVRFSHGGVGDRPVVGDWDGGGVDGVGIVGGASGVQVPATAPTTWYLRDANDPGAPTQVTSITAQPGQLLPGAWSGGQAGPSVWRPTTGTSTRRATPAGAEEVVRSARGGEAVAARPPGAPEDLLVRYADGRFLLPWGQAIAYGAPGYVPLMGDWDGDGSDTIGVWVPGDGTFYLRNSNVPGPPDVVVRFGTAGYTPLVGDWDGNGTDTIGVWEPAAATFHLRNSATPGSPDVSVRYGAPEYRPVVGDWDGNGTDTIGVVVG